MRVAELDLFRFIAALGVVAYHFVAWFVVDMPQNSVLLDTTHTVTQFGFLGVPLFFMISGFVILASAMHRSNLEFAAARVARLYPVYWFCVSLTALTALVTNQKTDVVNGINYLINLSMLQSFVGVDNFDGVYWTLAKELQFYFCIFVLLSLGLLKYVKTWITLWLVATALYLTLRQPFFMGWFISPEYSAFFISGVCFYMIYHNKDVIYFNSCLVVSLILACASIYREAHGFLHNAGILEVYTSIVIIGLFYLAFWLVATKRITLTASGMLLTLGSLTYPLYLTHNFIGKTLLTHMLDIFGPEVSVVAVTLLMIGLSHAIIVFVENPIATPLKQLLMAQIRQLNTRFQWIRGLG